MTFLKEFLTSKPVKVILLFILGAFVLSRDPASQNINAFMSFDNIIKRFPNLPKLPQSEKKQKQKKSSFLINENPLDYFFKSLSQTIKKNKICKILHYGDSIIWGDNVTRKLRQNFTNNFGNGGRGLLPIAFKTSDYKLTQLKQNFSKNWDINTLYTTQTHISKLGITLRSYSPGYIISKSDYYLPNGEGFNNFGIITGKNKSKIKISIQSSKTKSKKYEIIDKDNSYLKFKNTASFNRLNLKATKGTKLYGITFTKNQGVVYSPVVRKGIFAQDFLQINKKIFIQQLKQYSPDLVIFQFGKNESGWKFFDINKHRKGVLFFIELVRKANPKTSILLIGPAGRLNKYNGPLRLFPSIKSIIKVQKEISRKKGVAFFNTYEALGGEFGIQRLVAKGLAMTDYVHLTMKGGDILADKIYNDLIISYNKYQERNNNKTLLKYFSKKTKKEQSIKQASSSINFDTVSFIFFFLIVFFLYWICYNTGMLRIFLLLIASYFFYMSWNPIFIILIILSTIIDYIAGFLIYKSKVRENTFQKKFWLIISLSCNLGLLFFFKYFNLFSDFINQLGVLNNQIPFISLILPVGISFYTFQTMSYSLDIYSGKLKPIKSFSKFALFVSFFPQLVAGPIVRAREFLPQLAGKPKFNQKLILSGMFLIIVGLFKKVVISDYIAVNFVDRVFSKPDMYSAVENLFAVYGYGLQIYCDFSGYSDIAIGAAAMLGFRLPLNFNSPYKAHNLQNFWHRWHISLSTWLRDYLYIPLGGNKKGKIRTYLNLIITMLLGGLWHGAAYKFIIWGAIHGTGLAVVRLFQRIRNNPKKPTIIGKIIGWFITFHFVSFAWIFFRAKNMDIVTSLLKQISRLTSHIPNITLSIGIVLLGGYILHLIPNKIFEKFKNIFISLPYPAQSLIILIFSIIFYKTATSGLVPFIYFQF